MNLAKILGDAAIEMVQSVAAFVLLLVVAGAIIGAGIAICVISSHYSMWWALLYIPFFYCFFLAEVIYRRRLDKK